MLAAARDLFAAAQPLIDERGLTLIGDLGRDLVRRPAAPARAAARAERRALLDVTLDEIRDRFGTRSVVPAVLLGRTRDLELPLLPD